ncbi:MAG: isochorismatase family protein [Sneathiellales bacterium]|nr:isochorismatase family protein [Sneathiellales bacterium]
MPLLNREKSLLLIIDLQARLLPVIHQGSEIVQQTAKLQKAAEILNIPVLFTEQNPKGLGPTTDQLVIAEGCLFTKMTFDCCKTGGFREMLKDKEQIVVTGSEAHVCVLQTVLGLLEWKKEVFVIADAIGSRKLANKQAGIDRMQQNGAEIVTSEMALFEWLQSADNREFKSVLQLIK